MKLTLKMILPALLTGVLFLNNTTAPKENTSNFSITKTSAAVDSVVIQYTGKIKTIIDQKCYDCHSPEGDDEKAREELLWTELPKMDKIDQVYALDAIIESIEKGDMPPEKYIKKHPEAKLSAEEAKILIKWADELATKLYE